MFKSPVDIVGDITGIVYGQMAGRRGQRQALGRVWMDRPPYPQPPTARHAEFDLRR
jgi:hypothetical protein